MSNQSTPIINIFTYKLPKHLAQPIYTEFNNRMNEARRLINNYPNYAILKEELDTVELLLALSIFYKQVVANLDAAIKFHGLVVKTADAECVKIGSYELNNDEVFKIQNLMNFFNRITERYQISDALWNYNLTLDFLQRLITLKSIVDE